MPDRASHRPRHNLTLVASLAVVGAIGPASLAVAQCGTNPASCYSDHISPGCNDLYCCTVVCQEVPSCCTVAWDSLCVTVANTLCGPGDLSSKSVLSPVDGKFYALTFPGTFNQQQTNGPEDGTLATISSAMLQAWIRETMLINAPTTPASVRIGLNDTTIEGVYGWADGSPVSYLNWAPGQPGGSASLDSVQMSTATTLWSETHVAQPIPGIYAWSFEGCFEAEGSCFDETWDEGCDQLLCCNEVCRVMPDCCASGWDEGCADLALDLCVPGGIATLIHPQTGHIYVISQRSSWSAAQALAYSIGGSLATIETAAENTWLRLNLEEFPGIGYAWIGLTDERFEGSFRWASGAPVTYTNWGVNAPAPANTKREWVAMKAGGSGTWLDRELGSYYGIIELRTPGELNDDGVIDTADLSILLGAWGAVDNTMDYDESGMVDQGDLAVLLAQWGPIVNTPCVVRTTPGSPEQPACESCVCEVDPSCCEIAWDADCVARASGSCNAACQCAG